MSYLVPSYLVPQRKILGSPQRRLARGEVLVLKHIRDYFNTCAA